MENLTNLFSDLEIKENNNFIITRTVNKIKYIYYYKRIINNTNPELPESITYKLLKFEKIEK